MSKTFYIVLVVTDFLDVLCGATGDLFSGAEVIPFVSALIPHQLTKSTVQSKHQIHVYISKTKKNYS